MNTPWKDYIKPFRIYGNLYFIGTEPASSHLIATEEGLILIDTGYPQMLYLVIENIRRLGFDPNDVKYIIHSHGHYDHLGGTKAMIELFPGIKTFLGEDDIPYADGTLDLTWAKELGYKYYEAVTPDYAMHDGDIIKLGSTEILCLSTPGHSPGTMSFFFDVTENGRTLRAGMHGGVGIFSMAKKFLDEYGLSYDCREKFFAGLERLKSQHVDIHLGNHAYGSDTIGKAKRHAENPSINPFIDPEEWGIFLEKRRQLLLELIESEK